MLAASRGISTIAARQPTRARPSRPLTPRGDRDARARLRQQRAQLHAAEPVDVPVADQHRLQPPPAAPAARRPHVPVRVVDPRIPCRSTARTSPAAVSAQQPPEVVSSARRLPRRVSESCVAAKCSSAAAPATARWPAAARPRPSPRSPGPRARRVAAGPLARLVVDRAQRAEPPAVGASGGRRGRRRSRSPIAGLSDFRVRARVDTSSGAPDSTTAGRTNARAASREVSDAQGA